MFNIIGEIARINQHFKNISPNLRVSVSSYPLDDLAFGITIQVVTRINKHSVSFAVTYEQLEQSRDSTQIEADLYKQLNAKITELSQVIQKEVDHAKFG